MRYLVLFLLLGTTKGGNCPKHCRPGPNGDVPCKSGGCDEGCMPGFFGETCDRKCSGHCIRNICSFYDGTCAGGCQNNYCGDQCMRRCDLGFLEGTTVPTTKKDHARVVSLDTSSVADSTLSSEKTESYREETVPTERPEVLQKSSPSTDSARKLTPAEIERGTSEDSKVLLYSGIGVAVLLANVAIICFLYVCVRRILFQTNSRIEATHASIRVVELACIPQHPPEVKVAKQQTAGTSYLTATHDSANKDRVASTHEYDVIESKDLEPVMLLADCFDEFVIKNSADASLSDSSGGKYVLPI